MQVNTNLRRLFGSLVFFGALTAVSFGRDLRITLPKRTQPTPVQKLNRDGVKAVRKNDLPRAEKLFYRAYLIDPDDPFTLNNLGYVSELQGNVERAEQYYSLAEKENSDAVVADASIRDIKGKTLNEVTRGYGSPALSINHDNIEAMILLQKGRNSEAEHVLRKVLERDPNNPFTLNNLGYVMEEEGELDAALNYYQKAQALKSTETVVVALDSRWRGKPISEVAARNASALRERLATEDNVQAKVDRLNLQGVYAVNRNDLAKARGDFQQAYKLDPQNAFALNNRGFLAEMDGDEESANDYYSAAKAAEGANRPVAVASHLEMKGVPLIDVANTNGEITEGRLEAIQAERRQRAGPVQLRRRDNTPVEAPPQSESTTNPAPAAQVPPPASSQPPTNTAPIPTYVPKPPQN